MQAVRNQYFVCLGDHEKPIPWDPHNADQQINLHTAYFGRAFVEMEKHLETEGWTIYLTWGLKRLPSYGERVVAVVLGDEWCRIPDYAGRVGTVFKCYGTGPALGCRPFHHPSYQHTLAFFQYINARLRYMPGWTLAKWRVLRGEHAEPVVHAIPLGYANQVDLPLKPLENRDFDVSFAGSVVHKPYPWWSPKRWLQTPKSYSRQRLIEEMKRLELRHPEWGIDLKITKSYKAIRSADPVEYSERVMNTRISVAPRGTSYETFRFFEALRFGCVVITEFLPETWFYEGAPVVRLSDWGDLERVVSDLLQNPDKLAAMHRNTLEWWQDVCSEEALGTFLAAKLEAV